MSAQLLKCMSAPHSEDRPVLDDIALDRRQSDAFRQWSILAERDGGTPLRASFRPERSSVAMPAGMLLHVNRDGGEVGLIQKIEGRLVTMAFGEGGGRDLQALYVSDFVRGFIPRLLETVMTGTPAMVRDVTKTCHGTDFPFTRLILPFREESGEISRLFVVFAFDPHLLSKLDEPLPLRIEEPRRPPFLAAPEHRLYA